jgi:outer membrane protein TolC
MPALPKTINEALSIATSSHPELRQLQYQIKASELTVKRIKASSKAKMILNGDIGISDSDVQSDTLQASIGLRLSGNNLPRWFHKSRNSGRLSLTYRQFALQYMCK